MRPLKTLEEIRAENALEAEVGSEFYNEFCSAADIEQAIQEAKRLAKPLREKRLDMQRKFKSLSDVVIWMSFVKGVRHTAPEALYADGKAAIAISAGDDAHELEKTFDRFFDTSKWNSDRSRVVHRVPQSSAGVLNFEELWVHLRQANKLIVIMPDASRLPYEAQLAFDAIIDLRQMDPRHIRAGLKLHCKVDVSMDQAEVISTFPLHVISAIFRPGRSLERCMDLVADIASPPPAKAEDAPALTLDTLRGMGAAEVWGRDLIQDLADWKSGKIEWTDVDRGCLISGEPGTGKTLFAQALANSAGIPLVLSSFGKWQSRGHLGDMLKAMRADFESARAQAPCIWFVDELDSVGDRARFSSQHRDYCVQVVNAFLELLDGAESREGVVVIGATNNPSAIDAAVLRPGRLDNHVCIQKPDAEGREGILRFHLKDALQHENLGDIVRLSAGMSGADIEKLVRDAKRAARRQKRGLLVSDLMLSLASADHTNVLLFSREVGHA